MQPTQPLHPKLFLVLAHSLGLLATALVLAAAYAFGYRPLLTQQEVCEHRTEQLRGLLNNAIQVRRAHVQLTKEFEDLNARVARSAALTPTDAEESQFLADATRIAGESGLVIEDYRRGQTRHLATHSELNLTLSARGGHDGICRFLASMERLPRAKQITELSVSSSDRTTDYPFEVAYTLYFGLKAGATRPAADAAR